LEDEQGLGHHYGDLSLMVLEEQEQEPLLFQELRLLQVMMELERWALVVAVVGNNIEITVRGEVATIWDWTGTYNTLTQT
jgi:hypothetical protein